MFLWATRGSFSLFSPPSDMIWRVATKVDNKLVSDCPLRFWPFLNQSKHQVVFTLFWISSHSLIWNLQRRRILMRWKAALGVRWTVPVCFGWLAFDSLGPTLSYLLVPLVSEHNVCVRCCSLNMCARSQGKPWSRSAGELLSSPSRFPARPQPPSWPAAGGGLVDKLF